MIGISGDSRGFSLIELLVAMVVGLILLGGLVALMANSKKNYAQQDYDARLQENGRFAIQFLSYDIRMAGFYGCSNEIVNDDIAAVEAVEGGSAVTDEITISYGEPYDAGAEVVLDAARYEPYAAPLTLVLSDVPEAWSTGDALVLSDCGSASVADIATIEDNAVTLDVSGTASMNLGRIYNPAVGDRGPVTVRRLFRNTYTIEDGKSGIPVLMRNGRELVEGIENIQLLYQGLGSDAFVDGAAVPPELAAVQLGALVRSISNENLDDREYGSGDAITVDAGGDCGGQQDGHSVLGECVPVEELRGQRRVFSGALAVRNRTL